MVEHSTAPVADLSIRDRGEMLSLMGKYYLGVTRDKFENDLDQKQHVILLRQGSNGRKISGFSTLMRLDLMVEGEPVKAVFSGDTIVDRGSRGTLGLGLEITRYFAETTMENPGFELFYILIAKGWQTCRIPALLFESYSPSPDWPVSDRHKQVMDAFGAKKYPHNYQPETGLITFPLETQRIIPESSEAAIPPRDDVQVDFFVKKNPNYMRGDELVYVAPIAEWNFTKVSKKLLSL